VMVSIFGRSTPVEVDFLQITTDLSSWNRQIKQNILT
jgi:hypothetical protein